MRRRILIVLLSIGTVAGFGSGIAHVVHARHAYRCGGWNEAPASQAAPAAPEKAPER